MLKSRCDDERVEAIISSVPSLREMISRLPRKVTKALATVAFHLFISKSGFRVLRGSTPRITNSFRLHPSSRKLDGCSLDRSSCNDLRSVRTASSARPVQDNSVHDTSLHEHVIDYALSGMKYETTYCICRRLATQIKPSCRSSLMSWSCVFC